MQGPYVAEFERALARYIGAPHAVATSSGTTALHVGRRGAGPPARRRGDRAGFTWVSTANVVEYKGGRPVFCDIELDTFNLDVTALESLVTERTVGIMPVHSSGSRRPGPGHRLRAQSTASGCSKTAPAPRRVVPRPPHRDVRRRRLLQLPPAQVHHHGRGRHDHDRARRPRRPVALAPRPRRLPLRPRAARGGRRRSCSRSTTHLGFNFRLTDIQGALGCAQLDRVDEVLDGRRSRAARYDELLAGVEWLRTPVVPGGLGARLPGLRLPLPPGGADAWRTSTSCTSAATGS